MIKLDEDLLGVVWHGKVDLSLVVVPIELYSDVSFALIVFCYGVVLLQNVHEMSGVCTAFVFDAEVVNDESELDVDWSLLVYPEAGNQFSLVVFRRFWSSSFANKPDWGSLYIPLFISM